MFVKIFIPIQTGEQWLDFVEVLLRCLKRNRKQCLCKVLGVEEVYYLRK